MTNTKNNEPGLASYLVVAALVAIVGLFGWISERDYEYQQEIAGLRHALNQTYTAIDAECAPTIELSMPVELGSIQL